MSDWIDWHGGECPVDQCVKVDVELRDGVKLEKVSACSLTWLHSLNDSDDIIKYRIRSDEKAEAGDVFHGTGPKRSKYHREIKPGVWVDVYDVLEAFDPENRNSADDHAIKKMLLPGKRGAKDGFKDRREAIQSLDRSLEILHGD